MKNSEYLKLAKQKIINPENWIKGRLNAAEDGLFPMPQYGRPACKFCAVGAIHDIEEIEDDQRIDDLRGILARALMTNKDFRHYSVPDYNDLDKTTHDDIMKLYDKAIEITEQEENNGNA